MVFWEQDGPLGYIGMRWLSGQASIVLTGNASSAIQASWYLLRYMYDDSQTPDFGSSIHRCSTHIRHCVVRRPFIGRESFPFRTTCACPNRGRSSPGRRSRSGVSDLPRSHVEALRICSLQVDACQGS